ncbi:hypothetical protein ACFE04_003601 [Oxalis oulophora]
MAELALIGSDIQEVIGSAIALKILSNGLLPLWAGVIITALDCFIFLLLENYGVRKLEAVFGVLIAVMAISFAWMFGETKPNGMEVLAGIVVPKLSSRTIKQAAGVVGCIIMPHNVFLHSALVQSRDVDPNKKSQVKEALRYYSIESTAALVVSFIINLFVTTVFAKAFYGTDIANTIGLANAGQYSNVFLFLIATFRIASEFDNDELCKLVITVAHHSQAPEPCRNLGLTHKMPGIVELLIANGKELEAVRIIHYFELTEMFPTVPILKQYLKDLRRNSQGNGENYGDGASAAFVNGQELGALRAVIWCIKEFKLEAGYPLEPLEKRVFQLERSKIDKRSAGRSYKTPQPEKRPRPNGRYRGSRNSGGGSSSRRQHPPVYGGRPVAYNGNRYPHSTPPDLYNYAQVTAQPSYAPPQPNDQRMYYYPPQDDRAVQYNATPPPTNYSYLGGGTQPLQLQQPYM